MSLFLINFITAIRCRLQEITNAADKSDEINQKMISSITTCQNFITEKNHIFENQLNQGINSFLEKKFPKITFPDLSGRTLCFPLVDFQLEYIKDMINDILYEIDNYKAEISKKINKNASEQDIDHVFKELTLTCNIYCVCTEFRGTILQVQSRKYTY